MTAQVLVGVDGSEQSRTALEYALSTFPDARVTVLTAVDPVDASYTVAPGPGAITDPPGWSEEAAERAAEILDAARETAAEAGREVETVDVTDRPARGIAEYAEEHGVDHVVVGSHGRTGMSRILLGSVAEKVVRRSPCPVTVVR